MKPEVPMNHKMLLVGGRKYLEMQTQFDRNPESAAKEIFRVMLNEYKRQQRRKVKS